MAEATKVKKSAPKAKATKAKTEAVVEAKKTPKASKSLNKDVFAVITAGGKQYRVHEGQNLKIEKVLGDHKEGDTLVFKEVLLKVDGANATIGTPAVSGSTVSSTITKISRYKTVDVIKYKQKSKYFKKYGHRQPYFEVRIDSIN